MMPIYTSKKEPNIRHTQTLESRVAELEQCLKCAQCRYKNEYEFIERTENEKRKKEAIDFERKEKKRKDSPLNKVDFLENILIICAIFLIVVAIGVLIALVILKAKRIIWQKMKQQ